jgi:hypothetical protein
MSNDQKGIPLGLAIFGAVFFILLFVGVIGTYVFNWFR